MPLKLIIFNALILSISLTNYSSRCLGDCTCYTNEFSAKTYPIAFSIFGLSAKHFS
jgi:hypothetical protein